ncbi:TRAP transporter small permease [Arsenicitalea aurantiaca]|uniref:TRAP transporter small permease protein n=1 Tax=Arsenicitalea aurantiaca TaxID=1783274 RepID=A0A433X3G3_9HYPH|nr:TRAP transporter small permease [Arsenicitalea aurantiaca]RUT28605.1 TRAP transporter small permease [Arsenicitalea aurantiaca]
MSEQDKAPELDQALLAEIDQANDRIDDISWWDAPVFALFWGLIMVVFLQFFSRYVLNSSISWTEEIARYLLILVAFGGAIICARKNSHIFLDFFHLYLPKTVSKYLFALMDLVTISFFSFAAYTGITLAQRMANQRMISLNWPRSYLYYLIIACLVITALVTLHRLVKTLRS